MNFFFILILDVPYLILTQESLSPKLGPLPIIIRVLLIF